MNAARITLGVLLILVSAWMLLTILAFATLSLGDMEEGSPEWRPTYLDAVLGTPNTFLSTVGLLAGMILCLDRPGSRLTLWKVMILVGVASVLLGFFLRAATRERQWMEWRLHNPDGTWHIIKRYGNGFGPTRTVETDEP